MLNTVCMPHSTPELPFELSDCMADGRNNMLQQQTYTELDLAEIARRHVSMSHLLRAMLTTSDLMMPRTPLSLVQTRNLTTTMILGFSPSLCSSGLWKSGT